MNPTDISGSIHDQLGAVVWGHGAGVTAPKAMQGPLAHAKTDAEPDPPDTSLTSTQGWALPSHVTEKKLRHSQAEPLTQAAELEMVTTALFTLGPSPVGMGQDGRTCQAGGGRCSRGGNSRNHAGDKAQKMMGWGRLVLEKWAKVTAGP